MGEYMFIDKRIKAIEDRAARREYKYYDYRISFKSQKDKETFSNYIKSQKMKHGGSESDIVLKLIKESKI